MKKLLLLLLCLPLHAQSSLVEYFGTTTAATAYSTLGTEVNPQNQYEYAAAKAIGMSHVRFDATWADNEVQNCPANTSGGYSETAALSAGISNSVAYGMKPDVVGVYWAPFCQIATGTLTNALSVGSTQATLTLATGSLSAFTYMQTCLYVTTNPSSYISNKHSYCGVYLTAASGNTVTLASAATEAVPAGTPIQVFLVLYPPVLPPTNGSYLTLPGIVGYDNYVMWLAGLLHAANLIASIETWNEPPWSDECSDAAVNCMDNPPPNGSIQPGFGLELPASLINKTPPAGVCWQNGYSDESGQGSLFWGNYLSRYQPSLSVIKNFCGESMHMYSDSTGNPEQKFYLAGCPQSSTNYGYVLNDCTPYGLLVSSDYKWMVAQNAFNFNHGGLQPGVTETGIPTGQNPSPTPTQVTRADTRQGIQLAGMGVSPILFYRMFDLNNGSGGFGWIQSGATCTASGSGNTVTVTGTCNGTLAVGDTITTGAITSTITALGSGSGGAGTYTTAAAMNFASTTINAWLPNMVFSSFQGLWSDIAAIKARPVAPYSPCLMPQVSSYSGTYPLSRTYMVGSVAGNHANSILMFIMQRSFVAAGSNWLNLASPAAVNVPTKIPPGMVFSYALNVTTRTPVTGTVSGGTVSVSVSDDEIEIRFDPATPTTLPNLSCT